MALNDRAYLRAWSMQCPQHASWARVRTQVRHHAGGSRSSFSRVKSSSTHTFASANHAFKGCLPTSTDEDLILSLASWRHGIGVESILLLAFMEDIGIRAGLLNLMYDAMPAEYVTLIATEFGAIPPTSVPVILREYRQEPCL